MYVDFSYIRVPTVVSEIEWNALPLDMCKRVTIRIFEEKLTANSEITCDKPKPDFYVLGDRYNVFYYVYVPLLFTCS